MKLNISSIFFRKCTGKNRDSIFFRKGNTIWANYTGKNTVL